MNTFIPGFFFAILLTVLIPHPAAATTSGFLILDVGKLSANITATPLDQVLEEFSQVSGVPIRWLNGTASTEAVSVEFTNLPVITGLRRLLAKQQFILFYSSDTSQARLTQVWITNKGDEQSQFAASRSKLTEPATATTHISREEDDPLAGMQPEQLSFIALQENDPMLREKAINYLEAYAHKDRRALEALTRLAQQASLPEIQALAAEALRGFE